MLVASSSSSSLPTLYLWHERWWRTPIRKWNNRRRRGDSISNNWSQLDVFIQQTLSDCSLNRSPWTKCVDTDGGMSDAMRHVVVRPKNITCSEWNRRWLNHRWMHHKSHKIVTDSNGIESLTFVMNRECFVVGHEELSISHRVKLASRRDQRQPDFVWRVDTTYGVYLFIFWRECMKWTLTRSLRWFLSLIGWRCGWGCECARMVARSRSFNNCFIFDHRITSMIAQPHKPETS